MKEVIKFIVLMLSFFFISFSYAQNCKKAFAGEWRYAEVEKEVTYVERTKKKQFEYVENGKFFYEFDITWINDCKYVLSFVGTNSPEPSPFEVGEIVIVDILSIDDNKMQFKTLVNCKEKEGEMIRVE